MINWSRTTVLVTGGCGHIGSFVVRKLLERNVASVKIIDNLSAYPFDQLSSFCKDFLEDDRVVFIKGDIANIETVKGAINNIDIVFHLAAYADVAATIYNPDEDFRSNVIGTYNILKASLEKGVKHYIFASSAAVYGNQLLQDFSEPVKFHEDMKPNPLSPYANSKLWGENQARVFYDLYGLKTVSLRYFSVYGPLQVPKPKSHSWVIAIFLMRAINNKPLIVYGGSQVRDFIYVEDVAEATIKAAEIEGVAGEIINIGTGRPTRIDVLTQKIGDLVKKEASKNVEIKYGPRPKGDPIGGYADTTKMSNLLKFQPKVSLEEGLKKTLEWILKNLDKVPQYVLQQ
ncbi:MAG: NAD-dependent epimerase/dehydratase family protein [Candidatus Brockarchaeota archaeon]|uniref:NAD-dependent epimerase/dehydratase family protein n=1 Tax=Saccharolobus sp. TaxID=2100761 RepID=UPI00316347C2|nr:NAD-dependent epimerase/dehydratase family protein [Candidatus Brockarchaeota archaeon]